MELVYVAGPYTGGDVAVNVKNAIDIGMKINETGHYPIIPHLTHFMHMINNKPYDYWMRLDKKIIPFCSWIYRIPGDSSGADSECEYGKSLGIQTYDYILQPPNT